MPKLIQDLFAIERKAKVLREDPDASFGAVEHLALRHEESVSLIEKIRECTESSSVEVLPRSAVGKAVGYMRNQWAPLNRFLKDPELTLDNNAAELLACEVPRRRRRAPQFLLDNHIRIGRHGRPLVACG